PAVHSPTCYYLPLVLFVYLARPTPRHSPSPPSLTSHPPRSSLLPYTTALPIYSARAWRAARNRRHAPRSRPPPSRGSGPRTASWWDGPTSEIQSPLSLVCRPLLG